jgi:acyl dehydratase
MNLDALREHEFEPLIVQYTDKDCMLYALSLGIGGDPDDLQELSYIYEKNLVALPSMSTVLANPGMWPADPEFEINYGQLLHGEQRARFHGPLPPGGEIRGEFRISCVIDKGAEKGALVYFDKRLFDTRSGDQLCTVSSTLFLRADGGAGGFGHPPPPLPSMPDVPPGGPPGDRPDFTEDVVISPRAALIYRLNGDRNPLHIDPEAARQAGFEIPILHGLCAYGICGYSVLSKALGHEVERMASLDVRFSAPVYPGETLRIEGWDTGQGISFQAHVRDRNLRVISNGFASVD